MCVSWNRREGACARYIPALSFSSFVRCLAGCFLSLFLSSSPGWLAGRSLKATGRFSEATGAGGIRAELDYTAKGYIYRARMYAEARTSA